MHVRQISISKYEDCLLIFSYLYSILKTKIVVQVFCFFFQKIKDLPINLKTNVYMFRSN